MSVVKTYVADLQALGEEGLNRTFEAVLDAFASRLERATIDAVTGYPHVPSAVEHARDELERMGRSAKDKRSRSPWRRWIFSRALDPLMAIDLDLEVPEQLRLLTVFGPYSIHADIYLRGCSEPVVTVEDSSIVIFKVDEMVLNRVLNDVGLAEGCVKELGEP